MNIQNELITQIDKLMSKVWGDLREAADKKDSAALYPLNGRMAELGKMKKDLQQIITRLQEMRETKTATMNSNNSVMRKIRIRVTQGMINQNLMTLTEAKKNKIVHKGESFNIETLPNHHKFTTVLERIGNKLRARGPIADFYRSANVLADDIVEFTELSPNSWQLKKADVAQIFDY